TSQFVGQVGKRQQGSKSEGETEEPRDSPSDILSPHRRSRADPCIYHGTPVASRPRVDDTSRPTERTDK
ncbi:hypothetical protein K438DRAFT_1845168, partial [Mycena galopus ATCC 62051]